MKTTLQQLSDALKEPGAATRSAPFWGWNDRMQPDELRRQIDDLADAGMGGFFIHSREGLETPYLSEEWMDDVSASIAEAKKRGLEVWIYDEDKWPSGSAGGMVSADNPDAYTAKGLTLEILTPALAASRDLTPGKKQDDGTVLALYAAEVNGNKVTKLRRLVDGELPTTGSVLVLRREVSGNSEWYNGLAPADNLNPDAVKDFLRLTHEKYRARFKAEFGHTIKGFFTDEPDVYDFYQQYTPGRPYLPWTDALPAYFEGKRGYALYNTLPLLFFHGEGESKIRHDYWRTISDLFSESYMKQLYDWCEANGLQSTGHILYENDLGYNVRVCGAGMPQYRYLHAPGIDILGEQTKEYLTVKQCTSVANQYGRAMTITETYGCTGWELTFEGQRWLADWQFVMGITRRCQHLALYSIAGCRKRDYPPVFNYQSTSWPDDRLLEDYYARLNSCLTTGTVQRDLLVIHPMSSIWIECGSDPAEDLTNIEMNMGWKDEHIFNLNRKGEEYNLLAQLLLGLHHDFDFGDETILAENADVEHTADGCLLRVGQCRYKAVLVPRVLSLFATTVTLLKRFAEGGGTIIWVGELPALCEGASEPNMNATLAALPNLHRCADYEGLPSLLESRLPVPCHVRSPLGEDTAILTMLRKTEDGYLLFAVNNDRNATHPVQLETVFSGAVVCYDLLHGGCTEVAVEPLPGANIGQRIFAELAPAESKLYFIYTERKPLCGSAAFPYRHPHAAAPVFCALGPAVPFTRTMPNVLTLDCCRWQLDGGEWSVELPVWQAQRSLREALGMQQVYYNGAPQRYSWIGASHPADGTPFALDFRFTVEAIPQTPCHVAVEKPDDFHLTCNGIPCALTENWLVDRSMKLFALPALKSGENHLILSGGYRHETELEDIFLAGDFTVSPQRTLCAEPKALHFGDWCFQGYFDYPGSMVYHFSVPNAPAGKRILLQPGDYRATLLKVRINGVPVGEFLGRAPASLDVTAYLTQPQNALDLEAVGSPRNMFGPFHQTYTGCSRISWADFRTEGVFYTPEYVLEPYGLMGQITLSILN